MKTPPLILASASPRRAQLLRLLNLEFEVIPGQIEELTLPTLSPLETSLLNAFYKARSIGRQSPEALTLGADTIVHLEGRAFGKPDNRTVAGEMLQTLAGRTHAVTTGVCLLQYRPRRLQTFGVTTLVTFRPLSPDLIKSYLDQIDPLDKAGAYAIQEKGELLVEAVHGSYSNVVGLPTQELAEALAAYSSMS